jgi:hypothetical protein
VEDHHENHHASRPAVHRSDEPAKIHFRHDVAHGVKRLSYGGLVVKSHGKARCKLNQEAGEGDTAQAVKYIHMGRNVLAGNILYHSVHFQTLIKPFVDFTHEFVTIYCNLESMKLF